MPYPISALQNQVAQPARPISSSGGRRAVDAVSAAEIELIAGDVRQAQRLIGRAVKQAAPSAGGAPLKAPQFKPKSLALTAFRPLRLSQGTPPGFNLLCDALAKDSLNQISDTELNAVLKAAIDGSFSGLDCEHPAEVRPCGIALREAASRADRCFVDPTSRFMLRLEVVSLLEELNDSRCEAAQFPAPVAERVWPAPEHREQFHAFRRHLFGVIRAHETALARELAPSIADYVGATAILVLPTIFLWLASSMAESRR